MELEEKLCDEVETVQEFTYLGDRVSAGGGFEAGVTATTRCGWVKRTECGELLCGRRFSLSLNVAVYKCCVTSAIPYRSGAWCLKKVRCNFVKEEICGEECRSEGANVLVLLLSLNEAIDHLALANSVNWYGHVLMREDV